jgi:HSP20 family protein
MEDVSAAARGEREEHPDEHDLATGGIPMAALPVRRGGRNTSVVNPSREFEDIYDRMGQVMNFAFGLTPAALADMPWAPLADLSETADAYVVKAELPGVHKDQVNIQLQDRELVITGEIAEPGAGDGRRNHHSSRRTGRFELRTYMPGDVNADAITAQLSDGILTVTVPKSEASEPRRIEITG